MGASAYTKRNDCAGEGRKTYRYGDNLIIRIIIAIISYYKAIGYLQKWVQPIREDGPSHHHQKNNTPTMGGLLMVIGTVIQCSFNRELFHPVCLTLIGYGVLGLYDDMQKIRTKNNYGGLSPTYKFLLQWLLALTIVSMLSLDTQVSFLGYKVILSQSYRFFAAFIMVASSNAYNLTDGLDGLAATQGLILLFGYGVLAIATQHPVINIIVPLWIMLFGFYSVNYYPAKLFMGDVGSLSIGAVLGLLAIILKVEILFAFAASVMVFEVISVVLQVGFYKMGYGRIFKMAPFHHHLELCGWGEIKIVKVASFITMGLLYLCTYAV